MASRACSDLVSAAAIAHRFSAPGTALPVHKHVILRTSGPRPLFFTRSLHFLRLLVSRLARRSGDGCRRRVRALNAWRAISRDAGRGCAGPFSAQATTMTSQDRNWRWSDEQKDYYRFKPRRTGSARGMRTKKYDVLDSNQWQARLSTI